MNEDLYSQGYEDGYDGVSPSNDGLYDYDRGYEDGAADFAGNYHAVYNQ
jgi:hypothetical protein